MSDTEVEVARKAEEHSNLLKEIAALDFAASALQDNSLILKDVEKDLEAKKGSLKEVCKNTKREYEDLQSIQSSAAKRFFIRLGSGGKKEALDKRLAKEEKEYLEAFQTEQNLKDTIGALERQLAELNAAQVDLRAKASRHEGLKRQVQQLYTRVFSGPTPEFPQEDQAEQAFRSAEEEYQAAQSQLNKESRAYSLLVNADASMQAAIKKMQQAERLSMRDVWGGGGFTDMMERNALQDAKRAANEVERLVVQACQISPQVQNIGPLNVAQQDWVMDVLFDNLYTDLAFHGQIQQSLQSLVGSSRNLAQEIMRSKARIDGMSQYVYEITRKMNTRREQLESIRRAIFLDALTAQQQTALEHSGPAPPEYSSMGNLQQMPSNARAITSDSTASTTSSTRERNLAALPPLAPVTITPQVASPSELSSVFPTARAEWEPDSESLSEPQVHAPGVGGFRHQLNYNQLQGSSTDTTDSGPIAPPMFPIPQTIISRGTEDRAPEGTLAAPSIAPSDALSNRRVSWSMNPYAAALIRQAELERTASARTGSPKSSPQASPRLESRNPFLQYMGSPKGTSQELGVADQLSTLNLGAGPSSFNTAPSAPTNATRTSPSTSPRLAPGAFTSSPTSVEGEMKPATEALNAGARPTDPQEEQSAQPTTTRFAPPDYPPPGHT